MRRYALLSVLLAAFSPQDPGPKIADVARFSGAVEVVRGEASAPLRQVARRVVGGDLYDQDQLHTGDGATAAVLFADSTRIDVDEKTQIMIEQRRLVQPTESGKTIGRRIRLLTGHIVSDIVPSDQVQTDFVTPAGTAAVRGTLVEFRMGADGTDVYLRDGNIVFRLQGTRQGSTWNLGSGSHVTFGRVGDGGSGWVQNVGDTALEGQLGTTRVRLPPHSILRMEFGDNGFTARPQGGVEILNPDTGEFEPMTGEMPIPYAVDPPPETPPLVPLSEGGTPESPPDDWDVWSGPTPTWRGDLPQDPVDTGTVLGTTSGASFTIIDDFNRAASNVIGNGWNEVTDGGGTDWVLLGTGLAHADILPSGGSEMMALNLGNLSSFKIQGVFEFSVVDLSARLEVNGDGVSFGTGLAVEYFGTGSLLVEGPTGFQFTPAPVATPGSPFDLTLDYSGTTLTGTLSGTGSATVSTTTANTLDTFLMVGGSNSDPVNPQSLFVDEIRKFN